MIPFLGLIYFLWAVNTLFVLPGPTPVQYYTGLKTLKKRKKNLLVPACSKRGLSLLSEGFMLLKTKHTISRL